MYELFSEAVNGNIHHHLIRDGSVYLEAWDEADLAEMMGSMECRCAQTEIESLFTSTREHIDEDYEVSLKIDTEKDCIANIYITTKTHQVSYPNTFIMHESDSFAADLRKTANASDTVS